MDSLTLRDYYLGGFCLSSLGAFFNQLKMADHYNAIENKDLKEHCDGWVKHVQTKSETIFHRYLMVEYLYNGKTPESSKITPPSQPSDYKEWLESRHEAVLNRFDGDELICFLYLYGYCQGDIYTALVVLVSVIDMNTHFGAANPEQVSASVKRIQTILERWEKLASAISDLDALQGFGASFFKIKSKLRGPIELFEANPERLSLVQDELKSTLIQIDNAQTNLLKVLPAPISNESETKVESEAGSSGNPTDNEGQNSTDESSPDAQ
jgi:hypothetical protein